MYKTYKLKNGITVIGEEIPYLNSISLGVWINAGSRIESEENSGISHFIEHMLFKGTKNRTSKNIANEIDSLGGEINAFTSKDCTCYYVKLLDEHIDKGIDILSDMIINPLFKEEDIQREKMVILEELKMYEDSPEELAYDLLMENMYKGLGLGTNILGTEDSLENIEKEDILKYFNEYYVPNNSVISICGNFNFDDIVMKLEDRFKDWSPKDVNVFIPDQEFSPCFIKKEKDVEQISLAMSLNAISNKDDKEVYALAIINNIFGGSISSRLFQTIREDKGLVYSIYSSQSLYENCGELGIYASMTNENFKDVYDLVIEEIKNVRENYFTDEEINLSKEQLKGSYMLGLESTSSRMLNTGKAILLNKKVKTTEEVLSSINNVDKVTINNVIDKVFDVDNIALCVVGKNIKNINI